MVFKGLISAATALALLATPTISVAQQQTSIAASAASAAAAQAQDDDDDDDRAGYIPGNRRRGFIIPLFAITLIILGLLIVFDDGDGAPVSP